jgi:hypothetical protein
MDAYNPVAIPLEASAKLSKKQSPSSEKEESEMANIPPYRRAVGSFMYCMVGTSPDIVATVGVVAQFFNNPRLAYWQAVKRLSRYLQGLQNLVL